MAVSKAMTLCHRDSFGKSENAVLCSLPATGVVTAKCFPYGCVKPTHHLLAFLCKIQRGHRESHKTMLIFL